MGRLVVVIASGWLAVVSGAAAQADSTWRIHNAAAAAALRDGDAVRAGAELLALERQVGSTPRLAARLAALAFDTGDTAGGRRWTRVLAAMGSSLDTTVTAPYAARFGTASLDSMRRLNAASKAIVDDSRLVFRFDDADVIAEDVSYDAPRHRFLVSTVRRGVIYAVDSAGGVGRVFARPEGAGVWGIFAVGVDTARHTLWATTAAFPGTANYTPADSAKSALLDFDLRTGALRRRLTPGDGGPHALGDLAIAPDGTVYIGDGFGGGVYRLRPGDDSLQSLIASRTLGSPQTPVVSADGGRLFIPDYLFGVVVVDLHTRRWHWLEHPDSIALSGIDGLYRSGQDLIAVQNGVTPNRILRLRLDHSGNLLRSEIVARGGAAVDLNHAVLIGGTLYFITRSGWDRVDEDGTMQPATKLDAPSLRRLAIPDAAAGH